MYLVCGFVFYALKYRHGKNISDFLAHSVLKERWIEELQIKQSKQKRPLTNRWRYHAQIFALYINLQKKKPLIKEINLGTLYNCVSRVKLTVIFFLLYFIYLMKITNSIQQMKTLSCFNDVYFLIIDIQNLGQIRSMQWDSHITLNMNLYLIDVIDNLCICINLHKTMQWTCA